MTVLFLLKCVLPIQIKIAVQSSGVCCDILYIPLAMEIKFSVYSSCQVVNETKLNRTGTIFSVSSITDKDSRPNSYTL